MDKKQKKDKVKRKRLAARARAEAREQMRLKELETNPEDELLDEEEVLDDDEILDEDGEDVSEIKEKDYDGASVYAIPGPTSFDELDAQRVAEEKAQAVMDVTWDTRSLVNNILMHVEMSPDQKVEALKKVADGFGERVSTEMDETLNKDMDYLQLISMVEKENRNISLTELIADIIQKATLTAARENKLTDAQFALVVTRDGKKVRKYPIHDKAHVRNALARAAQMIKSGGQAAVDARAALPKIHATAKRMGIGTDNQKKDRNAIQIEKDQNGNWRWVGWVSNNFIDYDGDIISEDAHKEYVEWWEKNKDLSPAFLSWHTPGTARENPVDFMTYESGFLIASGILKEEEAATLLKAKALTDIGMSHGTFVLERDKDDPRTITKYRMYECSDLPLENAANPFTNFYTISKEVAEMDKKKYLAEILGSDEKAEKYLAATQKKSKELKDAGIENKEQEGAEVPEQQPIEPAPVEPVPEPTPVEQKTAEVDKVVEAVMKALPEAIDLEGLNTFVAQAKESIEKVTILEEVVKSLQGDQDEKLAEIISPRFAWSKAVEKRASEADDTKIKKEDKVTKSVPGVPNDYWLSQVTNTAPVKAE